MYSYLAVILGSKLLFKRFNVKIIVKLPALKRNVRNEMKKGKNLF